MAKTTVKQDARSLFVRANGSLYRPVPSTHSYPAPLAVGNGYGPNAKDSTSCVALQPVEVTHISQSPFCRVRDGAGLDEWWHSHGAYQGPSADAWCPAPSRTHETA
jgi:hypothetical protein